MWQTFLVGFIISALGSVPLGVINLTLIQITIDKGLKAAFQFIGIALLAEYFHVWLAVWLLGYIHKYPIVNQYFEWAAIIFIFIVGFGSLLKKPSKVSNASSNVSFLKAVSINFPNPFSIPFWLFFTTYALEEGWLAADYNIQWYFIAATLGALVTLGLYAYMAKMLTEFTFIQKLNIDKFLGWFFIGMGLWKLIKIMI